MTFTIEWHPRLGSTNAYMKERFIQDSGFKNGTIFATREQTAGRGRADRKWIAAPEANLCFSLFVETDCPLMEIPSLTMAAALAVADFLNGVKIAAAPKWPNDVLVNAKKLCGILSERVERAGRAGVIVGIGLNVNMSSEEAAAIDRPATSMLIESGAAADVPATLDALLPFLDHWIEQWRGSGFNAIREAWTAKAGPIGKTLSVHDGNVKKSGTLAGYGDQGELLLQTDTGVETIWTGDVS